MSMGRAFTAVADDASSVFLNPAGLSDIKGIDVVSMRASLINDINYNVVGVAVPIRFGFIGVGFINSSIASIPLTQWQTVNGVPVPQITGYTDYTSNLLMLSFSNKLGSILRNPRLDGVSVGCTLKNYSQNFTETSASLEGAQGSGIDMDLGVKWKARNWLTAGAVISNVIPESLGGKFYWVRGGAVESIPSVAKFGLAVKVLGEQGLRKLGSNEAVWSFDVEKGFDGSALLMHSGIEYRPVKLLSIRAGIDQQPGSDNGAAAVETNMTYGIGIRVTPFSFDYCYHRFGDVSENATHFFSIGYSKTFENPPIGPTSPPVIVPAIASPVTVQSSGDNEQDENINLKSIPALKKTGAASAEGFWEGF